MSGKSKILKIEHDIEFKKLALELDTLEFYTDIKELAPAKKIASIVRIKEIKESLYKIFKTRIESDPIQETDLFEDPQYLERLTNFSLVTSKENAEEKKRLLKKYSTYLHTKKLKALMIANERPFWGFWDFFNKKKGKQFKHQLIAVFTPVIGSLAVILFTAIASLPFVVGLGFLIPFLIVSIVAFAKSVSDFISRRNSSKTKIPEYHQKILAFDKFEKKFMRTVNQNPSLTQDAPKAVIPTNLVNNIPNNNSILSQKQKKEQEQEQEQKKKYITDFISVVDLYEDYFDGRNINNRQYCFRINLHKGTTLDSWEVYKNFRDEIKKLGVEINPKLCETYNTNNKTMCRYEFKLYQDNIKKITNFLTPPDEQKNRLGQTYFVKTIRSDEKDYFSTLFINIITQIKDKITKQPLRPKPKGLYHVNGTEDSKIEPKDKNNLSEQYTIDRPFSQYQPVSITFDDHRIALFQMNKENPVSGIAVKKSDVFLSDRLYVSDGGTVSRPNHSNSRAKAKAYAANNIKGNKKYKLLYDKNEYDAFIKAVKSKKITYNAHNEVLAGIRWNMEDRSSCLIICQDTLESRLLTLHRAKMLRTKLKKQTMENNLPFDESYQVPIVHYAPFDISVENKHLKPYNILEQRIDIIKAKGIAYQSVHSSVSPPCNSLYIKNKFEFLLALNQKDLEPLIQKHSPIPDLIKKKRLSILIPVLSQLKPETLANILSQSGNEIIEMMVKHPHSDYPEFIDLLIPALLNQSEDLNKIIFKLALIQSKLDNEKLNKFKDTAFIKNNFASFFEEIRKMLAKINDNNEVVEKLTQFINLDLINQLLIDNSIDVDFNHPIQVIALLQNKNYFKQLNDNEKIKKTFVVALRFGVIELIEKIYQEKITTLNILVDMTDVLKNMMEIPCSRKSVTWLFDKHKDGIDISKLSLEIKERLLIKYTTQQELPCFNIIDKLLNDNEFCQNIVGKPNAKNLLIFLMEQGKSKLFFKAVEKLVSYDTKSFSMTFKEIINSFDIKDCYNQKIISFMNCFKFAQNLKMFNQKKSLKLNLSAIKYLEPSMLKLIFENFVDPQYADYTEALKWVFLKINDPDSETNYPKNNDLHKKILEFVLQRIDVSQIEKFYLRKKILQEDCPVNPYRFFIEKERKTDGLTQTTSAIHQPIVAQPLIANWSR